MFTYRDYLYQVERHQNDITFAEQQRLAESVGESAGEPSRVNHYTAMILTTLAAWGQRMRSGGHRGQQMSPRSS